MKKSRSMNLWKIAAIASLLMVLTACSGADPTPAPSEGEQSATGGSAESDDSGAGSEGYSLAALIAGGDLDEVCVDLMGDPQDVWVATGGAAELLEDEDVFVDPTTWHGIETEKNGAVAVDGLLCAWRVTDSSDGRPVSPGFQFADPDDIAKHAAHNGKVAIGFEDDFGYVDAEYKVQFPTFRGTLPYLRDNVIHDLEP